jgi:hypothetical protein
LTFLCPFFLPSPLSFLSFVICGSYSCQVVCHSQSKSRLMMAGPALKNPISATIDPPFAVHALFCSMCNSCCCDIRCCCFSVKRLQRKVSRTAVIRLLTGNFLICNVNYSNYEGVGSGGCFSWVLCRLVRGKLARLC